MFNFLKWTERPVPTAVVVEDDPMPDGYLERATRLGLEGITESINVENERRKFRRFLSENGVCTYDRDAVHKYLKSICPKGHDIMWRSLTSDAKMLDDDMRFRNLYNSLSFVAYRPGVYKSIIPEPVLMTIEKIKSAFPDAEFYVSTFDMPKEDPFLAVLYANHGWIIERWDEPGFRQ